MGQNRMHPDTTVYSCRIVALTNPYNIYVDVNVDDVDVNKQICTDFRSVKCVSGEGDQPYRENISWYIRSDCLVQPIFNQSPPAPYFQQFTGSWYSLWITGNSLWHQD